MRPSNYICLFRTYSQPNAVDDNIPQSWHYLISFKVAGSSRRLYHCDCTTSLLFNAISWGWMASSDFPPSQSYGDILRELQRASKPELTNDNHRFVPRGALLSILTYERVKDYLRSILGNLEDSRLPHDIASYISPMGEIPCHCQEKLCTGSRVIFASLLHIGQARVIESFYKCIDPKPCDQDLPFSYPTRPHIPIAFHDLLPIDKEVFHHFQWQMRSPYFNRLGRNEEYRVLYPQVALPWTEFHGTDPKYGQLSYVARIQIENDHHNLVRFPCYSLVFDDVNVLQIFHIG